MSLRKSQVGCQVGIDLSQTIWWLRGGIAYDDFSFLPLIYIASYEVKLFHFYSVLTVSMIRFIRCKNKDLFLHQQIIGAIIHVFRQKTCFFFEYLLFFS